MLIMVDYSYSLVKNLPKIFAPKNPGILHTWTNYIQNFVKFFSSFCVCVLIIMRIIFGNVFHCFCHFLENLNNKQISKDSKKACLTGNFEIFLKNLR